MVIYIDLLTLSEGNNYFVQRFFKDIYNDDLFYNEYKINIVEKLNSITIIIFNCMYLYQNWPMMYEKRYYFEENLFSIRLYNRFLEYVSDRQLEGADFYNQYLLSGKIEDGTFINYEFINHGSIDFFTLTILYLIRNEPNFNTFKLDPKITEWIEEEGAIDYTNSDERLSNTNSDFVYEILGKYDLSIEYIRDYVVRKY
jgi:hypothetical protein